MTVTTRTAAPSYKIFEPDALDQILQGAMIKPGPEAAFAGALNTTHTLDKAANAKQFLQDQDRYNQMAAGLEVLGIDQKRKEAAMKLIPGLMAHGADAGDIRYISELLNPAGIAKNDIANLFKAESASKVAKNYADANAERGTPDTYTVGTTDTASGETRTLKRVLRKGESAPTSSSSADMTGSTSNSQELRKDPNRIATLVKQAIAATGDPAAQTGLTPEGHIGAISRKTNVRVVIDINTGKQINR